MNKNPLQYSFSTCIYAYPNGADLKLPSYPALS